MSKFGPRKKIEVNVTHTFADGRVMSDCEFMSKPFIIDPERNSELLDEAKMMDTTYIARQKEMYRREFSAARKQKLEEQSRHIAEEMAKLNI